MSRLVGILATITWAGLALVGCSPGNEADDADEAPDVEPSCDGLGAHMRGICQEFMGADYAEVFSEEFIVGCRAGGGYGLPTHLCAAKQTDCESMLYDCELTSISYICDSDSECRSGLYCSSEVESCVACLDDEDCVAGRQCQVGVCLDEGNIFLDL